MRSIPAIAQELVLIEAVAGDDWWQDVSVPMLELMRIRLRGLVHLIDGWNERAHPFTWTKGADEIIAHAKPSPHPKKTYDTRH